MTRAMTKDQDLTPTISPADLKTSEPTSEYTAVNNRAFGRYELLVEMGSGGMATLYLARIRGPEEFEKLLAVKMIHPHLAKTASFVRMFLDEARIAALIHHPNVVSTFDMGKINELYFIAMEYVHGQNLTDIIKATVRTPDAFPWTQVVRIIADAAAGLHAAHELRNSRGEPMSVVHRDVSPHNILVSYDGSVKVVDFGIAFAAEKLEQTAVGTVKGKAGYMSPDQAMGKVLDRRSDIFSLGTVLWECICRRRLFRQESDGATILRVREAKVPSMQLHHPGIPAELDHIAQKALAREVEDRYQTMEELSEALEELLVQRGELVQRRHVGRTIGTLFSDRHKLKDKQIRAALEDAQANPLSGVGMGDTQSLSWNLSADEISFTRAERRGRVPVFAAIGALAAAVLILALVLWSSFSRPEKGADTAPAPVARPPNATSDPMAVMSTAAPPPRRRAAVLSRIRLVVKVSPAEAPVVVVFRGRRYRGSSFAIDLPRSTTPETVVVHAKGYVSQSVIVVPTGDTTIPVALQKATMAPMAARPRARPRPRRRPRPRYRPRPRRRRVSNMLRDLPD